jgi:hypothetical protein
MAIHCRALKNSLRGTIPFGFSNMGGKSEHLTEKKENHTSSLKTYLLDLKTGSRIFGTMISAKKTENSLQN